LMAWGVGLVLGLWGGLRPGRDEVRMDADQTGVPEPYQRSGEGGLTRTDMPVPIRGGLAPANIKYEDIMGHSVMY
jgi:hypothetical protein